MQKTLLIINGVEEVFDCFDDALKVFQETIYDYIHLTKYVFEESSLPEDIGYFLDYRIRHNQEHDIEEYLYSALTKLFETFNTCNPAKSKEALKNLNIKNISYKQNNDEFDEEISINIKNEDNKEISVDINAYIVFDIFLKTNAFIFENHQKTYYYYSHQIINGTPVKEDCGKPADLNICLKPIESIDNSKNIEYC